MRLFGGYDTYGRHAENDISSSVHPAAASVAALRKNTRRSNAAAAFLVVAVIRLAFGVTTERNEAD